MLLQYKFTITYIRAFNHIDFIDYAIHLGNSDFM